jgi:hypothetical protein
MPHYFIKLLRCDVFILLHITTHHVLCLPPLQGNHLWLYPKWKECRRPFPSRWYAALSSHVLAPEVLFTSATCSALHQSDHTATACTFDSFTLGFHIGERDCSSVGDVCAIFFLPWWNGSREVSLRMYQLRPIVHQHPIHVLSVSIFWDSPFNTCQTAKTFHPSLLIHPQHFFLSPPF